MTGILPATNKIRSNYIKSIYQAGTVKIRIGYYPLNLPKRYKSKKLVMMSACNPGGRIKAKGWNKRMMQKLSLYLSGYDYRKGTGTLRNFSEPLFMVTMDPSKAIVLARKFRQNAIVVIQEQRLSRLVFLN